MSNLVGEARHEKRVKTFLTLRLFGPKTARWRRFYEETDGEVRRRPDLALNEEELAAEMEVFRRELSSVGTWPVVLVAFVTLMASTACQIFKGWPVALAATIAGVVAAVGVRQAILARHQQLWDEFKSRMAR